MLRERLGLVKEYAQRKAWFGQRVCSEKGLVWSKSMLRERLGLVKEYAERKAWFGQKVCSEKGLVWSKSLSLSILFDQTKPFSQHTL